MIMECNITLTEASKRAGISYDLARYYFKKYSEFIRHTGTKRKRLYSLEAVEVFKFISEAYNRNETETQIKEVLSLRFTKVYEIEADHFGTTETVPKSTTETLINELIQHVKSNSEMTRLCSEMKSENDQLRKENEQLRRYVQQLEQNKALENVSKSKKWWQFWK